MTLLKDSADVWLEAAYAYVRDQLRANLTVGLAATEGVKQVEVGEFSLESGNAQDLSGLPVVCIVPAAWGKRRTGNVIEHTVRLDVQVISAAASTPWSRYVDDQARHRVIAGRVYNEALHLKDVGAAAGHWDDWQPDGEADPVSLPSGPSSAILVTTHPFTFMRDRIWISEGT